jgi:alpha-tubulin suppressor-like RCC1 family protein
MSFRYASGIKKPGFNPLAAQTLLYNLYGWGTNSSGQLGLGNRTQYTTPKQVYSDAWSAVGSIGNGSLAIKTDGTLWGWGSGSSGRLGLGNTTSYSSPVQVGSLSNWSKLSDGNGNDFILSIKTDGTLWSWGRNVEGELGLGNRTNYSSPKQIGALTNWLNISCGSYHSIATKTDGTLWSWGKSEFGELGLGNLTSYSSPKQVGSLSGWTAVSSGWGGGFVMAKFG